MWRSRSESTSLQRRILTGFVRRRATLTIESSRKNSKKSLKPKLKYAIARRSWPVSSFKKYQLVPRKSTLRMYLSNPRQHCHSTSVMTLGSTSMCDWWLINTLSLPRAIHCLKSSRPGRKRVSISFSAQRQLRSSMRPSLTTSTIDRLRSWSRRRQTLWVLSCPKKFSSSRSQTTT